MKRQHHVGEVNWRVYHFVATEREAPGVLLSRAMAEGNAIAKVDEKSHNLSSGITHVTWPVRTRR